MKQHFHNALAVARFLESDPRVQTVIFPGKLVRLESRWCLDMGTVAVRAVCVPFALGDSG